MWGQEKECILFATNKEVGLLDTLVKKIPEEYRKRWNLETGYRVKNVFEIRTYSKSPVARALFFVIKCIISHIPHPCQFGIIILRYWIFFKAYLTK